MALSGSGWSAALYASLSGKGFVGSRLMDFTDAVGIGSVNHVVGKPFATTDTGTVPGNGVGSGTGVTGLSSAAISSAVFSLAVGFFGQAGSRLQDICDSIGDTCVAQMALATLTSTHTPVFAGTGVINVGSIGVVPSGWSGSVNSEGAGNGFIGSQWPNFATAIGQGQASQVLATGTGTVTITGSPTSPTPVPGSGSGSGVIT